MTADSNRSRTPLMNLLMGARLALGGGRPALVRAALTALGVGLGVTLLLGAASVPTMLDRGQDRASARATEPGPEPPASVRTALLRRSDTIYRGQDVRGRDLRGEGRLAPAPPGLRSIPAPGTMVVSPALARLLRGPSGRLLRERLDARVVGRISDAGLLGPDELTFYRGRADLRAGAAGDAQRIDHFGDDTERQQIGPLLSLVVAIAVTVLLLPIAVFVAGAVRFGGPDRDRRLAALRLVGANRSMTARIAAGETLVGALAGIAVGACLFLAARPLAERISLQQLSVFTADVRPSALIAAAIVVGVPVCAVVSSLLALRRVVVEPLGVVRVAAASRRRLWWRVVPAVFGAVALLNVGRLDGSGGDRAYYQAAVGALLLLVGLTVIVPWLVDAVVGRLSGGGPLSWQLATRRLQVDGGTAARVVSGVAVAVAGAIALQTLFAAAERQSTTITGADTGRAQVQASFGPVPATFTTRRLAAALDATPGVRSESTSAQVGVQGAGDPDQFAQMEIADCRTLSELYRTTACAAGDVFLTGGTAVASGGPALARGDHLLLGDPGERRVAWTIPAKARSLAAHPDPVGNTAAPVLATLGALAGVRLPPRYLHSFVRLDPADPDAIEQVRTTVARLDPSASVQTLEQTSQARSFRQVRRALFAAATLVLALIGTSLLVGAAEQLRERRRVLAVLVAFGTRRTTLAASVLWQTAVPVALGLAAATAVGIALGALLLSVASQPVRFDWSAIAALVAVGIAIVAAVTALSLPGLWRGMRPSGLRTE